MISCPVCSPDSPCYDKFLYDEFTRCPWCGCGCDLSAKTIHGDEDCHCNSCGKDSVMKDAGLTKHIRQKT